MESVFTVPTDLMVEGEGDEDEGEGEGEGEGDLPTPEGLSATEASLLRWVRALVELFDARAQVEA